MGQHLRVFPPDVAESNLTFSYKASTFAHRALFIMSDDPSTVGEVQVLAGKSKHWDIYYCEEVRRNIRSIDLARSSGAKTITLQVFLNVEIALEADAWVGTIVSNFAQLFDLLRMTVGGKASSPFLSLVSCCFIGGPGCKPICKKRHCREEELACTMR